MLEDRIWLAAFCIVELIVGQPEKYKDVHSGILSIKGHQEKCYRKVWSLNLRPNTETTKSPSGWVTRPMGCGDY